MVIVVLKYYLKLSWNRIVVLTFYIFSSRDSECTEQVWA